MHNRLLRDRLKIVAEHNRVCPADTDQHGHLLTSLHIERIKKFQFNLGGCTG